MSEFSTNDWDESAKEKEEEQSEIFIPNENSQTVKEGMSLPPLTAKSQKTTSTCHKSYLTSKIVEQKITNEKWDSIDSSKDSDSNISKSNLYKGSLQAQKGIRFNVHELINDGNTEKKKKPTGFGLLGLKLKKISPENGNKCNNGNNNSFGNETVVPSESHVSRSIESNNSGSLSYNSFDENSTSLKKGFGVSTSAKASGFGSNLTNLSRGFLNEIPSGFTGSKGCSRQRSVRSETQRTEFEENKNHLANSSIKNLTALNIDATNKNISLIESTNILSSRDSTKVASGNRSSDSRVRVSTDQETRPNEFNKRDENSFPGCINPNVKKWNRGGGYDNFSKLGKISVPLTTSSGTTDSWDLKCGKFVDLNGKLLKSYEPNFKRDEELFDDVVENKTISFNQSVVSSMASRHGVNIRSFEDIENLPPQVLSNLKRMKMTQPTAIQAYTYYPILSGKDLVACAHTGCGKTVAFLLPFVNQLANENWYDSDNIGCVSAPRCLIISPTRELAIQTYETARQLCYKTGITTSIVYGGYRRNANMRNLTSHKKLGILVATVGRLMDFLASKHITLSKLKYVVLDEADNIIDDENALRDISRILGTPANRTAQVVLFSASFSEKLQNESLPLVVRSGFTMILADKFGTANELIEQSVIRVTRYNKQNVLLKLLGIDSDTFSTSDNSVVNAKTLIFVNSVKYCVTLAAIISSSGIPTISIHSLMNQENRDSVLESFRRGKYKVMVSSNLCARGLHITGLTHVINYDLPFAHFFDDYVNRIGRTGRAGFEGYSTALFCPETDMPILNKLISVIKEAGKKVPDWLEELGQKEQEKQMENNEQW